MERVKVTTKLLADGFFQNIYSTRVSAIYKLYKRPYKGKHCRLHTVYLGFDSIQSAQSFIKYAQGRSGFGKDFEVRLPMRVDGSKVEVKVHGMKEEVLIMLINKDLQREAMPSVPTTVNEKLPEGVSIESEGIGARVFRGRDRIGYVGESLLFPGQWQWGRVAGRHDYRMNDERYGSRVEAIEALCAAVRPPAVVSGHGRGITFRGVGIE